MEWASRLYWLWPALVTLAIVGVRPGQAEPWRDELATWSAASRPLHEVLRLANHIDAVTSPYYLLMWCWIRITGDSALAMRLPSLVAIVVSCAVLTVLGRRLFGPRVGVSAGLLYAVLPITSRYAQEARGYGFAMLFAVTSTLLLVRALERPTFRRWAGYALALYGLALANLLMLLLLLGHAVAVLTAPRVAGRRPLPGWLVSAVVVGIGVSPLLWLGRHQSATQLDWVPPAKIEALPDLPGGVFGSAAVGGLILGLAALGWAQRGRWGGILGLAALGPVVVIFFAGQQQPVFVARYLIFTVPLLTLLAAATMDRIRPAALLAIVSVVAFLGANSQLGLRSTHEWPRSAPRAYSAAARIIDENERPGDGIVYPDRGDWAFLDIAMAYHLGDRIPRDVLLRRSAQQRGTLWASECSDPAACLAGTDRIWLLGVGERTDPMEEMPDRKAAALDDGYVLDRQWTVPGLTVRLLVRRG
ncbi:hypothetical protein CIK06_24065 [Plantactinospora sp. KBS50]|nr:hypothetical protein CIK06_24065 [Plantactinospora sp. KBS50]